MLKGSLKASILGTRWLEIQTKCKHIVEQGEKQLIKQAQNGGWELSEHDLECLYLDVARKMIKHRQGKAQEKQDEEDVNEDTSIQSDGLVEIHANISE